MRVTINREEVGDIELEVEYSVTSRGYPPTRGRYPEDCDPGEGPSWEINEVWYLDENEKLTTSASQDLTVDEYAYINERVRDAVEEEVNNRDEYDYDPCAEDPPDDDVCDQYWDPY